MQKQKTSEWLIEAGRLARWTADEAEKIVEAQKQSGDSLAAFARSHGLPIHRLRWWKERLRQVQSVRATLVPVEVREAERPTRTRVTIRLASGTSVEVEDLQGTGAPSVAALILALEVDR